MEYPIVIEQDPEARGYVVYCPTLKGCVSQGETEKKPWKISRMPLRPTSKVLKI